MGNLATDILNPDVASEFNPDFAYVIQRPKSRVSYRPRNSRPLERQIDAQPFVIDLTWQNRTGATAQALRQWEHRYEDNFFQLYMPDVGRYYAGRFMSPLDVNQVGYENWAIRGVFEELVGCALFEYPTDWDTWGVMIDEQNDFGDIVCGVQGNWPRTANARARGGFELLNGGANNTDFAKMQYFGYGFRLWLATGPDRGQLEVSFDDVVIVPVLDLYSAVAAPAQPLVVNANASINIHSVKLRSLGVRNVASSNNQVVYDAVEIIR